MRKWMTILSVLFFCTAIVPAQSVESQLSGEYQLHFPFANVYHMEQALVYSYLSSDNPWHSAEFRIHMDRALSNWVDLKLGLDVVSTVQNDTSSTFELRPVIGAKFHFTPHRRILTNLLLRYEHRNFRNQETGDWDKSQRSRVRPEILIPFNKPTMFAGDKLWYGFTDLEWFIVMDDDLKERFANRFRLRIGTGYRFSYSWRLEAIYVYQDSRSTIGAEVKADNNIFQFVFKHYINKSRLSTFLETN